MACKQVIKTIWKGKIKNKVCKSILTRVIVKILKPVTRRALTCSVKSIVFNLSNERTPWGIAAGKLKKMVEKMIKEEEFSKGIRGTMKK